MYPQEGTSGFPMIEVAALKEPFGCTIVTSFACNIMIDGGIGGRKPSKEVISKVVS